MGSGAISAASLIYPTPRADADATARTSATTPALWTLSVQSERWPIAHEGNVVCANDFMHVTLGWKRSREGLVSVDVGVDEIGRPGEDEASRLGETITDD